VLHTKQEFGDPTKVASKCTNHGCSLAIYKFKYILIATTNVIETNVSETLKTKHLRWKFENTSSIQLHIALELFQFSCCLCSWQHQEPLLPCHCNQQTTEVLPLVPQHHCFLNRYQGSCHFSEHLYTISDSMKITCQQYFKLLPKGCLLKDNK